MGKEWNGIVDDGGFSEEDERVYNESMAVIRQGMEKGLGFDEACREITVQDPELRRLIMDDYLKVVIANLHFEGEMSVEEVAKKLKIPVERVLKARQEMIDEVRDRSIEYARKEFGDIGQALDESPDTERGPKGNA